MHVRGERNVPKGIPQRSSSSVYRMSSIRSAALFFLNELMIVRIRSTVSRAIMLLPMLTCELLWSNRRPLCGTKPVKQGARKDGFVSKSRHMALPVRARWYVWDGGGRGPRRQHGHGRPIVKSLPLCRLSRAHNPAGRRCGTRVAPGCVRGGVGAIVHTQVCGVGFIAWCVARIAVHNKDCCLFAKQPALTRQVTAHTAQSATLRKLCTAPHCRVLVQ